MQRTRANTFTYNAGVNPDIRLTAEVRATPILCAAAAVR